VRHRRKQGIIRELVGGITDQRHGPTSAQWTWTLRSLPKRAKEWYAPSWAAVETNGGVVQILSGKLSSEAV